MHKNQWSDPHKVRAHSWHYIMIKEDMLDIIAGRAKGVILVIALPFWKHRWKKQVCM